MKRQLTTGDDEHLPASVDLVCILSCCLLSYVYHCWTQLTTGDDEHWPASVDLVCILSCCLLSLFNMLLIKGAFTGPWGRAPNGGMANNYER